MDKNKIGICQFINNNNRCKILYTSQPILLFFKVVDDGVRYDSESNTLFKLSQFLKMAYHSVN